MTFVVIDSSPPSHFIGCSNPKLSDSRRQEAMVELKLFGLVRVESHPVPLTLVPLQFIAGNGGAIVLRGIPTKCQAALRAGANLWGERFTRGTSWNLQDTAWREYNTSYTTFS